MHLTRRHLLTTLPIAGGVALGIGFSRMLRDMKEGRFDPHAVNTPWLGRTVPDFSPMPGLPGLSDGFGPEALRQQNRPVLVNFLASWCIPCVMEMPFLRQIAPTLTLWGIAYKDKAERVSAFLNRNGQPYQRLGDDVSGRVAIEWGVTGVPESFLILPGGKIAWHGSAALDETVFHTAIRPLLEQTQ